MGPKSRVIQVQEKECQELPAPPRKEIIMYRVFPTEPTGKTVLANFGFGLLVSRTVRE